MILRNSNNVCKKLINYNSYYNLVKHTKVSIPSFAEIKNPRRQLPGVKHCRPRSILGNRPFQRVEGSGSWPDWKLSATELMQ
jgi:hypothetical protein